MTQTFLLYCLFGCALALLAWPVVGFFRGRLDGVGLAVSLSIPVLVAAVFIAGASTAHAQNTIPTGIPGIGYLVPPPSQVAGPYSHWFPPGQTGFVVTAPPRATPVAGPSGGSVNVSSGGTAVIARPAAPRINVPVAVNTKIPAAAAANAAARVAGIARGLTGPVGVAWTGWTIYKEIKDSGVHTCPPPAFFCFPPSVEFDKDQKGWAGGLHPGPAFSINEYVQWFIARNAGMTVKSMTPRKSVTTDVLTIVFLYPNGRDTELREISFAGTAVNKTETPGPPMSDTDIEGKIRDRATSDTSGNTAANLYNAATEADRNLREAGQPGVPQTVMQPPAQSQTQVTSPPVVVSNEALGSKTTTNADGSTSTTTSTGQATVTPTSSGNGSSTTITYNYNYQITNVTQTGNGPPVTNTETIIVRIEPEPAPAAPPTEFPKDYSKEATQQRIENLLRGEGVPDGSALSSQSAETSIKAGQSQLTGAIDQVTPSSLGLASWLPDIPTAQCVNPTVPNPLKGGDAAEIEICKPVSLFSKFISAVICVFVLYGCVREVQSAIKT